MYTVSACMALMLVGVLAQQPAPSLKASALSFEFFKTDVQPIFLKKRQGHARCIACHGQTTTPLDLQPLPPGRTTYTDEESRKNFEAIRRIVGVPGNLKTKLLLHPLEEKAGGDFYHNGGKHFASQNDPEWQTLKAWVMGQTAK